jgi:hypothetical protein
VDFLKSLDNQGAAPSVGAGVNARLLRDGPVSRIVGIVKRFVKTFGYDYNLTINLSNIPADTPSDHVHAVVAAIHTYGRKPIADDIDQIEFTPPQRESFQEWRRQREASA